MLTAGTATHFTQTIKVNAGISKSSIDGRHTALATSLTRFWHHQTGCQRKVVHSVTEVRYDFDV